MLLLSVCWVDLFIGLRRGAILKSRSYNNIFLTFIPYSLKYQNFMVSWHWAWGRGAKVSKERARRATAALPRFWIHQCGHRWSRMCAGPASILLGRGWASPRSSPSCTAWGGRKARTDTSYSRYSSSSSGPRSRRSVERCDEYTLESDNFVFCFSNAWR